VLEEPHKLRGSIKARQECMGPRAVKDTVCISLFDEMMSIYPGVSQRYTPCCDCERENSVYWLECDN
jgi:hypothetical protein